MPPMLVVKLINSDIPPKAVLTITAARAFAKRALEEGETDRAEVYKVEGAANAGDAISGFLAGLGSLQQSISRPLTPEEADAATKALEQRRILDLL